MHFVLCLLVFIMRFFVMLIWNIFECRYGDACNQSIINAIHWSVNTRKNRSLYFSQIIWIGVLFFVHSHCFWQNIVVFTKMGFFSFHFAIHVYRLKWLFQCVSFGNSLIVFAVWNFSHFFEASSLSRSPVLFFDVLLDLRVRTRKNNFQTVKLWIQIRNEYAYMSLCMYEQHFEGSSKFLTAPDS